jgi:mono/diheme cytochrome c family protein
MIMRHWILSTTLSLSVVASVAMAAEESAVLANRFAGEAVPFVKKHCVECHGAKEPKADLSLAGDLDVKALVTRRGVWENVIDMVETGQMPPKEVAKPDPVEVDKFVTLVKTIFDDSDRHAKPDPGRVTVRRLNRVEYNNTIHDLVGVDFNPAEDFPSDDIGHGFDNIGDVLTLSPVLMERYLSAAESIVNRAIVPNPPKPSDRGMGARYLEPAGQGVSERKWRGISTRPNPNAIFTGPLHTKYSIPDDGEYNFKLNCYAETTADGPVQIAILVCGKNVPGRVSDEEAAQLSGLAVAGLRPFTILQMVEVTARSADKAQHIVVKVPPTKGIERMAVAIVKPAIPPSRERAADEPADASNPDRTDPETTLYVDYFGMEGPLDGRPAAHRRLLAVAPNQSKEDQSREVLNRFASRAYRRPATGDEIDRLMAMAAIAQNDGLNWDGAMQRAFMAVLVSPKFLFRLELNDRSSQPEAAESVPLDEYQLASRLSYFLWSSMPDDELFDLARRGELTKNLDAQIKRMLASPRSKALVDNFAMQWLQLKRLKTYAPDPKLFPSFNEQLRNAMAKETELFFESIVREDRSVLEMLDADYTYLNETLARHYGIADTAGNWIGQKAERPGGHQIPRREFVRVNLPEKLRGGLLTQASILTVTSNPTRTSPVKRGRWVLEQILGAPPPPPPPDVPELPEGKEQLVGSLRQRMEQHRANPACANCHAKMDPIGFAFENYDAIGAFRTKDGEFAIETAGVLPDGKAFQGPGELKTILMEKRHQFTRCLTEKLMIYALGRGLEYYDRRPVMQIQDALAKNDYKFSALVAEIVKSEPFRLRRGKEE